MLTTLLSSLQYDIGEWLPPAQADYFVGGMSRPDGQRDDPQAFSAITREEGGFEMETDIGSGGFLRLHVSDKPRTDRYLRIISERVKNQRGQFDLKVGQEGLRQHII